MSNLTKEIVCSLVCSDCNKYLSVPPIKVYHNRQVKCGRCCNKDDGGTKSSLYEMVIRDVKFPCINHMEGCTEYLSISQMNIHENHCKENKYYCPVCLTFEGSSYEMSFHIKKEHKELMLEDKYFLITFDHSPEEKPPPNIYFFCDNELLVFIIVKYESNTLWLELNVARGNSKSLGQRFSLCSTDNKLLYQTKESKCNVWGSTGSQRIFIDLSSLKHCYKVVICKFNVVLNTTTLLPFTKCPKLVNNAVDCNLPSILDPAARSAVLRCEFHNVSKIKPSDKSVYSSATYYVMNIPWKISIQKMQEFGTYYLSCYLDKNENESKCYAVDTFILVSKFKHKNICRSYTEKSDYSVETSWGVTKFVKWDIILDPKNGYVEHDTLKIEIILNVEPKEEVNCSMCKSVCTTCFATNFAK